MAAEEQRVTLKMTSQEVEDKFRDSLSDVLVVVERIAPTCNSVEDLVVALRLGLENDVMLRMLMNKVRKR